MHTVGHNSYRFAQNILPEFVCNTNLYKDGDPKSQSDKKIKIKIDGQEMTETMLNANNFSAMIQLFNRIDTISLQPFLGCQF